MTSLREPSSFRPLSRSHSRASSRDSGTHSARGASPARSIDDNVSSRQQISILQHTVRHQKAQLQHLETLLQRSTHSTSVSSERSQLDSSHRTSLNVLTIGQTDHRLQRSSSLDQMQSPSTSTASLLSPKRLSSLSAQGEIKEGAPTLSDLSGRRSSSPTRTLSRIPVASVGHARALAEDVGASSPKSTSFIGKSSTALIPVASPTLNISTQPSQATRRISYGGGSGNTTKVLADLQAGVTNARNALENTRAQLRMSQRSVAQLTRQAEDLKDGKERLRLENEGLNNVLARKERLLQEVLERARKAEAEAADLRVQLKTETMNSRRSIRDMEAQVQQSTTVSHKSEREYVALRDSFNELKATWARQLQNLENAMQEKEVRFLTEASDLDRKYCRLVEEISQERGRRGTVDKLIDEKGSLQMEWEHAFQVQVDECHRALQQYTRDSNIADKTVSDVSNELQRLRGLIRAVERSQTLRPELANP